MRAQVAKMARHRQNRRTGFQPVSIFSPSAFIRVDPWFRACETIKLPNEPILENEHSPMNTDVFALFCKPPNRKRIHLTRTPTVGNGERARPGRCESRPRGSLLRVKSTHRLVLSHALPASADQGQSTLLKARNFFSEQQSRTSRHKASSKNSCSFVSIRGSHRSRKTTKSANNSANCGKAGYNSSLTLTQSVGKVALRFYGLCGAEH